MRLPTLTEKHRNDEDARAFHERLWLAFQRQAPLVFPRADGYRICDNYQGWWINRGYRFRMKTIGVNVEIWLVKREPKRAVVRVESPAPEAGWRSHAWPTNWS